MALLPRTAAAGLLLAACLATAAPTYHATDSFTAVVYSQGKTPANPDRGSEENRGTIAVKPNQYYEVSYEVLRNDLGGAGEKVLDVTVDGVSLGGECNPDGDDYDCTFFDCYQKTPTTLVSATGTLEVNMRYTEAGGSWDCDCDTSTWECSEEGTVGGRTKVTAVGQFTFKPVTDPRTCRGVFDASVDAKSNRCTAYETWTACDAMAMSGASNSEWNAAQEEHAEVFAGLFTRSKKETASYDACVAKLKKAQSGSHSSSPQVRTARGSVEFTVGQAEDVTFVRTKRDTVSIYDLNGRVQTFETRTAAAAAAMGKQIKATADGAAAGLGATMKDASKGTLAAAKQTLADQKAALGTAAAAMKKTVGDATASVDKEVKAMAELQKKQAATVAAFDLKLKVLVAAEAKEATCSAKGEIFNGKACVTAAGAVLTHPSETMTVACNKDYSAGPVCVLKDNFRANNIRAHDAAQHCAKQPHGRMCSSAEVQYLCQKGKFKGKSVRDFVWVRGAEGDGNQESPGVYVNQARCENDDWNRDTDSGTALCCRDKEINVGCQEKDKNGKDTGFRQVKAPGGAVIGCRGYQSGSKVDPLQSQRICYDKNQRWGSSAETNMAYFNGHQCPTDACWMDGGEGNNNQEFQGRNRGGVLDDWSYDSRLGTQCYVTYLPPIKTTECWANGGIASGSVCLIAWNPEQRFYYYGSAMSCAVRGHRLCWSDEMFVLQDHGVLRQTLGHGATWIDGGEGNDNHEETGFNHNNGRLEDWNSGNNGKGNTRLQYACCRTIGFFDGQSKDFTISQRGPV